MRLQLLKKIAIVKTDTASAKLITRIEAAAQAVLDARQPNKGARHVGKAVDAAHLADGGQSSYAIDGERVAFLFKCYAALTRLV